MQVLEQYVDTEYLGFHWFVSELQKYPEYCLYIIIEIEVIEMKGEFNIHFTGNCIDLLLKLYLAQTKYKVRLIHQ